MKTKLLKKLSPDMWSAVLTWLMVSGSCLFYLYRDLEVDSSTLATAAALSVFFILSFMRTTKPLGSQKYTHWRWMLIGLQYLSVLGLYLVIPFSYIAILLVIWSAQIIYYLPVRAAFVLSFLWSLPTFFIFHFYWQQPYMVLTAALYWMFNLFAMMTVNMALRETLAKEEAQRLNSELQATQSLLDEAARQSERLNIARNIHDVVGHHLTALSINLQVAARKANGESREQIEQCHSLSRLLLADVREAVSDIRANASLDLKRALSELLHYAPGLEVKLEYDEGVNLPSVEVADTLLRAVQEALTNSLRHSGASVFSIAVKPSDNGVTLNLSDNGQRVHSEPVIAGNGLKGMAERVSQCGGAMSFHADRQGFHIQIDILEQRQ